MPWNIEWLRKVTSPAIFVERVPLTPPRCQPMSLFLSLVAERIPSGDIRQTVDSRTRAVINSCGRVREHDETTARDLRSMRRETNSE